MSDPGAEVVRGASRTGIIWGILTIMFGVFAIAAPGFAGVAVTTLVAVFLIAAGIAQTIFAFKAGSFGKGFFAFLFGLFAILCGLFILARPLFGLASITMVLAAYFFIDGISGIIMSFRLRPVKGWGWMLVSSIAALVLGFLIVREWPVSGGWAVGVLVGVRLIFAGWTMIALGTVGDVAADEIEQGTT